VNFRGAAAAAIAALLLAACADEAPNWDKLVTAKIRQQYPNYIVSRTSPGNLVVERPGLSSQPVDTEAIGKFCQRGTKDCDHAIEVMLMDLAPR
jgi:hypothetical protein